MTAAVVAGETGVLVLVSTTTGALVLVSTTAGASVLVSTTTTGAKLELDEEDKIIVSTGLSDVNGQYVV